MRDLSRKVEGSAQYQGRLWSTHADDWAVAREGQARPLYEAAFRRIALGSGTRLLDVGCGSGYACALAVEMGAGVSGLDASQALLDIARRRVRDADFQEGEMEDLPYPDQSFDAVTGFNSFQYAGDPVHALIEARRVVRPGGPVLIATWGKLADSDSSALYYAMRPFMPPRGPLIDGLALSAQGALEETARAAGLEPLALEEVDCTFAYPDLGTALKGLLSGGPVQLAIHAVGKSRVREAAIKALAPFRLASGGYRLRNRFRFLVAR